MHSYTFPYKEGRVVRDLELGFLGGDGGVATYENPGCPVSKPGVSQSRAEDAGHADDQRETIKNLSMGFLNGLFSSGFSRGENGPLKRSGKRPIKHRKRRIKADGLFSGTPPWWKTVK